MSETGPHRASDAEREAVADRLRTATAEGRLDPDELDERLSTAYGARTRAELEPLTADLPAAPPPPVPKTPAWRDEAVRHRLAGFITANVVCLAVWAASGADGDFWPKWVLLGTGIGLVVALVHAVFGIEDEHDHHHVGHGLPGGPPSLGRPGVGGPRERHRRYDRDR